MYYITNILATIPTGMWEKIILTFNNAFASVAISIIVLTLCIKLVTSPIEFFNRRINNKTMRVQEQMKPDIIAIKKRYPDINTQNQKINELYRNAKFSPIGSFFFMLLNLGLTIGIFITLLNGLNNMAAYKITDQYEQLQIAYVSVLNVDITPEINSENYQQQVNEYIKQIAADETLKTQADLKVQERFDEVKESFLWIQNIWLADTPLNKSIPSFSDYAKVAKLTNEQLEDKDIKAAYEQIMTPLRDSSASANGYFILVLLSGLTAFLNQYLIMRKNKSKKDASAQPTGKFMLILMPVIIALFTLVYTSMFSIYLITSQIVSIAILPIINKINDILDKRQEQKQPTNRMKRI